MKRTLTYHKGKSITGSSGWKMDEYELKGVTIAQYFLFFKFLFLMYFTLFYFNNVQEGKYILLYFDPEKYILDDYMGNSSSRAPTTLLRAESSSLLSGAASSSFLLPSYLPVTGMVVTYHIHQPISFPDVYYPQAPFQTQVPFQFQTQIPFQTTFSNPHVNTHYDNIIRQVQLGSLIDCILVCFAFYRIQYKI